VLKGTPTAFYRVVARRLYAKCNLREGFMKITICIGSSCHIHGSRPVVEQIQELVERNNLQDRVELASTFCMGKCRQGVCVTVDGEYIFITIK